jgi:hypothetical protein
MINAVLHILWYARRVPAMWESMWMAVIAVLSSWFIVLVHTAYFFFTWKHKPKIMYNQFQYLIRKEGHFNPIGFAVLGAVVMSLSNSNENTFQCFHMKKNTGDISAWIS